MWQHGYRQISQCLHQVMESILHCQGGIWANCEPILSCHIRNNTPVARYLQLLIDGAKKIRSTTAAFNFYFKQGNNSFKGRSIRNWAEYLIKTGASSQFKQGQHKKTHSIIVEEAVQAQVRTAIKEIAHFSDVFIIFVITFICQERSLQPDMLGTYVIFTFFFSYFALHCTFGR